MRATPGSEKGLLRRRMSLFGGFEEKSAPLITASVLSTEIREIVPFILNCTYDLSVEHELCEFRNLSGH